MVQVPLHYETIKEIGRRIRQREISLVEVVSASLARIKQLNPKINAFITVLAEESLAQAEIAEAEIKAGHWRGPLHGIPVGIKDMYDTAGVRTTAAFANFKDRIPTRDAVAVTRLQQAGAIIVGKTNMHKLAMGTTSAESDFGAVRNPWNSDYITGGSSGGSAAAVASGMCYATLDTDAVGSCRLPASCCGVTGFKGTYRLIDNSGILADQPVEGAIVWLAHAAITARTVEDVALVLNVLAESNVGPKQSLDYVAELGRGGTPRIGVVANFSADQEVRAAFEAAIGTLRGLGRTREIAAPLETPGFDVRNIEGDRAAIATSLFDATDVLALPTTSTTTPTINDAAADPMALSAQNTLFANYYGLPALSVPCGFDGNGLPLGLQIVGKPWGEPSMLSVAHRYQQATAWSRKRPSDR
jgi:aspartyl-tRNA(Asn)/glutamyl-tRNA(Gln) amidotransferase subunit A